MVATNKCLAQRNKSRTRAEATKKGRWGRAWAKRRELLLKMERELTQAAAVLRASIGLKPPSK